MNKYIKKIKTIKRNNDGFSLIELVVAVGILAILSVLGIVAYSNITDNARKAAVDSAASEVLTGAIAYDSNGDDYKQAEQEWMGSADKDNEGNSIITVEANKSSNGEICVVANGYDYTANKGAGCENSTGNPGGGDNNGEIIPPVIDTYTSNLEIDREYTGMAYEDLRINLRGTLPAGSEVIVQTQSQEMDAEDFPEWLPKPSTNNLEVVSDNTTFNEVGYNMYAVDTTYKVVSDGSIYYDLHLIHSYYGANVRVVINLPEGGKFKDGSSSFVYDQVPEHTLYEEW